MAFLTGVPLALFYVFFGIPMSWLADRSNRRNILAASLIVWSGFTALCGLSRNYLAVPAARIGVGIGETGGTPPANSIIADYFPADRRPMALAYSRWARRSARGLGATWPVRWRTPTAGARPFSRSGIPGVMLGVIILSDHS